MRPATALAPYEQRERERGQRIGPVETDHSVDRS